MGEAPATDQSQRDQNRQTGGNGPVMPDRESLDFLPKLRRERRTLLDIVEGKRDKVILALTRRY
jgi:hypothetical protein